MKTFNTFVEGFVNLSWSITLLSYGLSPLIYGLDHSPSNKLIISLIVLGFLKTQIMIEREIEKLKDEL